MLAGSAYFYMIGAVTAPIIFGKMHFLLISQNEFLKYNVTEGQVFMEFMLYKIVIEFFCCF